MRVMAKHKTIARVRINVIREKVLRVLYHTWSIVGIVKRVKVVVDDVVTEISEFGEASRIAVYVGWAKVGGDHAEDVADSHFVVDYLVVEVGGRKGVEVLMRPRMAGDLMARVVHTLRMELDRRRSGRLGGANLDYAGIAGNTVVDFSFSQVVTS